MKPLPLAIAASLVLGGAALAQNTKGTGAETKTTTTTNPLGSSIPSDTGNRRSHATEPSGTNRGNAEATAESQPKNPNDTKIDAGSNWK
jgi:hypothetical protein